VLDGHQLRCGRGAFDGGQVSRYIRSLLLQSGSFLYSDPAVWHGEAAYFDPVVRFVDRYRAAPVRAAEKAFISCGSYEDLLEANRSMLPIFRSTGMKINYVESHDGHSWESWRDQLGPGLCWLFPGDLAR
jgi:enterochelin esterase family protein